MTDEQAQQEIIAMLTNAGMQRIVFGFNKRYIFHDGRKAQGFYVDFLNYGVGGFRLHAESHEALIAAVREWLSEQQA